MSEENLKLLGSITSIIALIIALFVFPYKKMQKFMSENFELMGPILLIIIFALLLIVGYLTLTWAIRKQKIFKGEDNVDKFNEVIKQCSTNIEFLRKIYPIQTEEELKENDNKIEKLLEEERRAKKIYVVSNDLKIDLRLSNFQNIIYENLKEWFMEFCHNKKTECKYTYFIPKGRDLIKSYMKKYFTDGFNIMKHAPDNQRNDLMLINEIEDNLFVEIDSGYFEIFGTSPERSYYEFPTNEEPKFYNFKILNRTLVALEEILTDKDFELIFQSIRKNTNNPDNTHGPLRTDKIAHRFEKKAKEIRVLTPDLHIDLYHPLIRKVVKAHHKKQKENIRIENGEIVDNRNVKYYYLIPKGKELTLINEFSAVMEFDKTLNEDRNYLSTIFRTIDNKDILKIGFFSEITHYTFGNNREGSKNKNFIAVIFPPTIKNEFSELVTIGGEIFRSYFLKHFDELWNQAGYDFLQ